MLYDRKMYEICVDKIAIFVSGVPRRGLGVQTPPEIPKISVESSIA